MSSEEKLFVLGHPVSHSKSPVMYNAVYRKLGLPWRYGLADFAEEADAQAFLDERDFLSINITTPYKPLALKNAVRCAPTALLAQGANVLVKTDEGLVAHNTDGLGCVAYLKRRGVSFAGSPVVVCGTGPTSLSILYACVREGAHATLLGRSASRTASVLEAWGKRLSEALRPDAEPAVVGRDGESVVVGALGGSVRSASYDQAQEAIGQASAVINATPLGMKAGDPAPFDTAWLQGGTFVFDAVYGHGLTALVEGARARGCTACDGGGMLVAQAVASVQIVAEQAGVELSLSADELFDIMAAAAEFDLS